MVYRSAALRGALLSLPFLTMNAIVANRIDPFFSMIRPGPHTSTLELVLLFVVLACLPLGAFIAARPMFHARGAARWRGYVSNAAVAAVLLVAFVVISVALGEEIYRCEVLQVPNCD